jgi:ketosteroid isomerase-like protein
MSEQNVELVQRIYAAWREGASARALMAPDIEYVNPPDAVEPGILRGPASFGRIRDAYDEVVVLATLRAVGRASGVPVERHHGYVWTVRDGLAVRFCWFNDQAEALASVGLTR